MEYDVAVMLVVANYYWGMWSLETSGDLIAHFKNLKHAEARM